MNVCSIWPFAQISDDFYYLDIWQCARYFVAALFKELQLWSLRPPNLCVVHLFFQEIVYFERCANDKHRQKKEMRKLT